MLIPQEPITQIIYTNLITPLAFDSVTQLGIACICRVQDFPKSTDTIGY